MHFAIRYLTEYRYAEPVTDNLNALRVKPATTPHQRVDDFGVRVVPETRLHQHLDYYGTTVIEFGVSRPHDHLSIDVRARVKTSAPELPPAAPWGALEEAEYQAAGGEFLLSDGSEPNALVLDELVGLSRAESPPATSPATCSRRRRAKSGRTRRRSTRTRGSRRWCRTAASRRGSPPTPRT